MPTNPGQVASDRRHFATICVTAPTEPTVALESGATLSSFGEDEAGELYATDLSSGELLHVVATAR